MLSYPVFNIYTSIIFKMSVTRTLVQKSSDVQETVKKEETEQKKEKDRQLLILRFENKSKPRVSWTEDTIDNEHMNKRKSNLCCIYHRPGQSSSDTCTSDDEGNALQRDRHTKHLHKKKCSKLKKKQEKPNQKNVQKKIEKECCNHSH